MLFQEVKQKKNIKKKLKEEQKCKSPPSTAWPLTTPTLHNLAIKDSEHVKNDHDAFLTTLTWKEKNTPRKFNRHTNKKKLSLWLGFLEEKVLWEYLLHFLENSANTLMSPE